MNDDYAKIMIINNHSRQLTPRRGPAAGAAVTDNLQNIDYDAVLSRGGSPKKWKHLTHLPLEVVHILCNHGWGGVSPNYNSIT